MLQMEAIGTLVTYTMNTLDLNIMSAIWQLSNMHMILFPEHITEKLNLIRLMNQAAVAANTDGLMIEIRYNLFENAFYKD